MTISIYFKKYLNFNFVNKMIVSVESEILKYFKHKHTFLSNLLVIIKSNHEYSKCPSPIALSRQVIHDRSFMLSIMNPFCVSKITYVKAIRCYICHVSSPACR